MTASTQRCPHCGADLTTGLPEASGNDATQITDSWEVLRAEVAPPSAVGERPGDAEDAEGTAPAGPTWWLPSLAYLAHAIADEVGRAALDRFATHRNEFSYAVVEEETDTVLGLTIQPWPIVDADGRLRFPIRTDPLQVDVPVDQLTELIRDSRREWAELGLLQEELVDRAIHLGDVYAVVVTEDPGPESLTVHSEEGSACHLGPLHTPSGSVPIVDITWDAREAGKLAHYAAVAGVVDDRDRPQTPDEVTVVSETEERYLVAYSEQIDPRDVPAPEEST